MDFNVNIGENMSFDFKTGILPKPEATALVGAAEIISDGAVGISGVAEFVESIIQEV